MSKRLIAVLGAAGITLWLLFELVRFVASPSGVMLRDVGRVEVRDTRAGASLVLDVDESVFLAKSRFQIHEVVQTHFFGKVSERSLSFGVACSNDAQILLLDGDLMFTERDEANYHEMMAYVAGTTVPKVSTES